MEPDVGGGVHVAGRQYTVAGGSLIDGGPPLAASAQPEIAKLLEICALASDATVEMRAGEWAIDGSPTEAALLRMALNGGVDVEICAAASRFSACGSAANRSPT